MSVAIFTEARQSTGLGHFRRCTALAEILSETHRDVIIVLDTDGLELGNVEPLIIKKLNWSNRDELISVLKQNEIKLAIVDSYLAKPSIYQEIYDSVNSLICIDDTNRISYPNGSVILNPGLGGRFIPYDKSRNQILTGPEFILLRKPFRENFQTPERRENIQSVLLSSGGTDFHNLIPNFLKILNQNEFSSWKKEVIVGPDFNNLDLIESLADKNTTLHSGMDALAIRNLMLKMDIAITAGGQTTYELARCGVPMIIIQTAANQKYQMDYWRDICSCLNLNELDTLQDKIQEYTLNAKRIEIIANYPKQYTFNFERFSNAT